MSGNSEKHSLLLDTGDFLFKTSSPKDYARPYYHLKASFVARAYDELGYDCAVLSSIDFALGHKGLSTILDGRKFTVLAGNLKLKGKPLYPQVHICQVKKFYVGVIGLLATMPPSLKDEGRNLKPVSTELDKALERIEGFCDLTVLLLSGNRKDALDVALNTHTRKPHIILFGDNRFGTGKYEIVKNILLVEGAGLGRYLGRIQIDLSQGTNPIEKYTCDFLPVAPSLKRDLCTGALSDEYKKEVRDLSMAVSSKGDLQRDSGTKVYWGKDLCMGCHPGQAKHWKASAHSAAFATLEKAGREMDIECLPCHTLGFGKPQGYTNPFEARKYADVQCESCHGPGVDHGKPVYRSRLIDKKMCIQCHDREKSPDFDYEQALKHGSCQAARFGQKP